MEELFSKNAFEVVSAIFVELSPGDLHTCRQVCHKWNDFIIHEIWKKRKCRTIFQKRLMHRWICGEYKTYRLNIHHIQVGANNGVKTFGDFLVLHPQLYTQGDNIVILDSKSGQKLQERKLPGILESSDVGSNFLVTGLSPSNRQSRLLPDTIEVIEVPGCQVLARLTLPIEQNKELYCVSKNTVLFLREYRNSLDVCQFILLDPISKEKQDFIVKLCFADVLCLRFDGEYALVKTINKEDKITVFHVKSRSCVIKDFPAANFTLNEVFRYPLSISIEDHCNLKVVNLKTGTRHSHFIHTNHIHTNQNTNTEIGLLNRMLVSDTGFLFISRYQKFGRDHSNCASQVDIYRLDDIKYGIFRPSVIKIRENGPLFDDFHVDKTKLVTVYSGEKRVQIFNFWS